MSTRRSASHQGLALDGGDDGDVAVPAAGSRHGQDPAAAAATSAARRQLAGDGALAAARSDGDAATPSAGPRAGAARADNAADVMLAKAIANKASRAKRKADQDEVECARATSAPASARDRVPRRPIYSPSSAGAQPQRSTRKLSVDASLASKRMASMRAFDGNGAGAPAENSSALRAVEPCEGEPARGPASAPACDSPKSVSDDSEAEEQALETLRVYLAPFEVYDATLYLDPQAARFFDYSDAPNRKLWGTVAGTLCKLNVGNGHYFPRFIEARMNELIASFQLTHAHLFQLVDPPFAYGVLPPQLITITSAVDKKKGKKANQKLLCPVMRLKELHDFSRFANSLQPGEQLCVKLGPTQEDKIAIACVFASKRAKHTMQQNAEAAEIAKSVVDRVREENKLKIAIAQGEKAEAQARSAQAKADKDEAAARAAEVKATQLEQRTAETDEVSARRPGGARDASRRYSLSTGEDDEEGEDDDGSSRRYALSVVYKLAGVAKVGSTTVVLRQSAVVEGEAVGFYAPIANREAITELVRSVHDLANGNLPPPPQLLRLFRLGIGERTGRAQSDRLTLVNGDNDVSRPFYAPSSTQHDLRILHLAVEVTVPPKHLGKVGGGGLVASGGWAGAFGAGSASMPAPQAYGASMPGAHRVALAQQVGVALESCKAGWDASPQAWIKTAAHINHCVERQQLFLSKPETLYVLPELKPDFEANDVPRAKGASAGGARAQRAPRARTPTHTRVPERFFRRRDVRVSAPSFPAGPGTPGLSTAAAPNVAEQADPPAAGIAGELAHADEKRAREPPIHPRLTRLLAHPTPTTLPPFAYTRAAAAAPAPGAALARRELPLAMASPAGSSSAFTKFATRLEDLLGYRNQGILSPAEYEVEVAKVRTTCASNPSGARPDLPSRPRARARWRDDRGFAR